MRNARTRIATVAGAVVTTLSCAAVASGAAQPPPPAATQDDPTVRVASTTPGNPLAFAPLYVDRDSRPEAQASRWESSRPADARLLRTIAREPQSMWLGSWYSNVRTTVSDVMGRARAARQMPVFVAYNIPYRDCFGISSGGATTAKGYRTWIAQVAKGIGSGHAAVILEPDALAAAPCLTRSQERERIGLLRWATKRLSGQPNTAVYIDAGHAKWVPARAMAKRLRAAGVDSARGFALNTANFHTTAVNRRYGNAVSRALGGGAHYVVDTGRNGLGPRKGDWCNPPGRALGAAPTTQTGSPLMDAGLWIKAPGESDGTCNGGPGGGAFWPSYAVGLVKRAEASVR